MDCVLCDREGVVGIIVNERLICYECWALAHKILGVS